MTTIIPSTTIFAAQSFQNTYLSTNKPPTKDRVYPSYRGFFQGCEITLKRKSMKSGEWLAVFTKNGVITKTVGGSENLAMRRLLDQMDAL